MRNPHVAPMLMALALAGFFLAAPRAQAQDAAPTPQSATATEQTQDQAPTPKHAPAAERAWSLIVRFDRRPDDVTGLAEGVLDLPDAQRQEVRRLQAEQEAEKARLLDQLAKTYADKVRQALTDGQKPVYDTALAALQDLAAETAAARKEFLDALGPDAQKDARLPEAYVSAADLTQFLGLDEARQKQLQALREKMYRSLAEASAQRMDPAKWTDPEAWQEQRKQFREAQNKARAEFEAGQAATLSPDQLERLNKLEATAQQYERRLWDARRKAFAALSAALEPAPSQATPPQPSSPPASPP